MNNSLISLAFIYCFLNIGCVDNGLQVDQKQSNRDLIKVESKNIAILPYDSTFYWIFNDCKQTELTENDFQIIENLLIKCLEGYNSVQENLYNDFIANHPQYKINKRDFIIDLNRYKRQYVAVLNHQGEKEVWINCFCDTQNQNWRKQIIQVLDGGNCYFNLKMNLTTRKYYNLMVNGVA